MTANDIGTRKPRADAERNRLRLMAIAKVAFADKGTSASLDDIARAAGVGIATLYRHFPSREALIGQLYENEGEQLANAATRLSQAEPPLEAIRQWLMMFIDYLSTKQIMAEVLSLLGPGADRICAVSGDKLIEAMGRLLTNAKLKGDVCRDVEPLDLLMAIGGASNLNHAPNWEKGAVRLVDIIIAGLTQRSDAAAL
ncbi:TetR/AcrR family transcriptional regulator (plasmid) [Agrobacterium sp. rho-8.1]|nr:TetR/AcrR family transcriptional regulator [Agrobacterium sp. rho-8.1]